MMINKRQWHECDFFFFINLLIFCSCRLRMFLHMLMWDLCFVLRDLNDNWQASYPCLSVCKLICYFVAFAQTPQLENIKMNHLTGARPNWIVTEIVLATPHIMFEYRNQHQITNNDLICWASQILSYLSLSRFFFSWQYTDTIHWSV